MGGGGNADLGSAVFLDQSGIAGLRWPWLGQLGQLNSAPQISSLNTLARMYSHGGGRGMGGKAKICKRISSLCFSDMWEYFVD